MRILHITSHLNVGGISSYILSLSEALQRRGHRIVIASGGGQLEAQAVALGFTHWTAPLHTSAEFSPQVFRAIRQLAQKLRQEPVDLIHAHTRVGQVAPSRLSRAFSIPYVTTWHGFFRPNLGRRLWPCTGALTIAISEPVRRHLVSDFHVPEPRVRLILNGVDPSRFAEPPSASALQAFRERWRIAAGEPVIGAVGRLAAGRVKGFDLLIEAVRLLERDFPHLQVVMVGDGPRWPFVKEKIDRFGLGERVHLTGPSTDVRIPLAVMDVFVFPVRWNEGFGLSLIEAMAAGKPVVASRTGAVPDIVEHGRSGWLVNPEDPPSLAEGIARLLAHREEAGRLALAGQQRVRERFSLEQMAERVEAVYREVVR